MEEQHAALSGRVAALRQRARDGGHDHHDDHDHDHHHHHHHALPWGWITVLVTLLLASTAGRRWGLHSALAVAGAGALLLLRVPQRAAGLAADVALALLALLALPRTASSHIARARRSALLWRLACHMRREAWADRVRGRAALVHADGYALWARRSGAAAAAAMAQRPPRDGGRWGLVRQLSAMLWATSAMDARTDTAEHAVRSNPAAHVARERERANAIEEAAERALRRTGAWTAAERAELCARVALSMYGFWALAGALPGHKADARAGLATALRWGDLALASDGDNACALVTVARCHAAAGRTDAAQAMLARRVRLGDADARDYACVCYAAARGDDELRARGRASSEAYDAAWAALGLGRPGL